MLKIYNTLTRKKQVFTPRRENNVKAFCCGPTVYNYIHLGNAKTFTQFDLIIRYLRYKGYNVQYVQNITDVDDKIIKRAHDEHKDWKEIARTYETAFLEDTKQLGLTSANKIARATDYIPEIVSQVQRLIKNGNAYKISDGYYFDLSTFKDYGKLAKRTEQQQDDSVSRIDENPEKRNKGDFCLWKFSKPGEPSWDTALGSGRPGWHIEDTAITEKELGPQYDLHGGGIDLIFPHHEAEIAQMESILGKKPFVKYWTHIAFLNIAKEKMSKSVGNFFLLRDVLKNHDARAIRFVLISAHYRTPLEFSPQSIDQAKNTLQRIDDFTRHLHTYTNTCANNTALETLLATTKTKIEKAMDDDFETPTAFAALFAFIKKTNTLLAAKKLSTHDAQTVLTFLTHIDTIFEIHAKEETIPADIQALVQQREAARKAKKWKDADTLRDQLHKQGYAVDDSPNGPIVKKI